MTMHIRRGPLFWGLLLIPLGAVPLLVRAGVVDAGAFADVWRLWPIVLVGLGVLIIVGRGAANRGRASLVSVAIVAIALGVAGGSALASGSWDFGAISGCGDTRQPTQTVDTSGTFDGPATLRVELRCGTAAIGTSDDEEWRVDARYGRLPPAIDPSGRGLDVRAGRNGEIGRQDWTIEMPAASFRALDLRADAATASVDLGTASVEKVEANVNAADLIVDAGDGSLAAVDVQMNAGRVRLTFGRGPVNGAIEVNAGAVDLCVPAGSALRLTLNDQLTFGHNLAERGLSREGGAWTRAGSGDEIQLRIEGNAAALTLDPAGGCR